MKIKIEFTIDVNEDAWATEYGLPLSEVRADVKSYVENCVKDGLRSMELLTEGA